MLFGYDKINSSTQAHASEMAALLSQSIKFDSISGREKSFVEFICNWAQHNGFETDIFETDEAQLSGYIPHLPNHIPLKNRPTLVIRLRGNRKGKSLILNAHSDVVAAGRIDNWTNDPWSGCQIGDKIYGRGACDAKGPLIGALWAMLAIKHDFGQDLSGDVLLELIPGEEDCVGLGTLTSISRGYNADAAIILEPTENLPRCASRSGIRFEIMCPGKAVHGIVKWLGKDAISMMRKVLDAFDTMEAQWNDRAADVLFSNYPITRPITVDLIQGGDWQGMIADTCRCEGYLELLPDDKINEWKKKFVEQLRGLAGSELIINFHEEYLGHKTPTDNPLCVITETIIEKSSDLGWQGWSAFNSGCEAGVRANLQNTPTLVWGPGSVSQAHASNEFISFKDIEIFANILVQFMISWSQSYEMRK